MGHETDFTLCDFAADLRAPTPSAAAELAVPDRDEMRIRLDELLGRIENASMRIVNFKREKFSSVAKRLELLSPSGRLAVEKKDLERVKVKLNQGIERIVQKRREALSVYSAKLVAINPLAVLSRGYSYTQREETVISSVNQIKSGDVVNIRFADGSASAEIISVNENN